MAFSVDKNTSAVTMHKGDTGAYYVTLTKRSRSKFVAGDVALYRVKQGNTVKIDREFPLNDDNGAGNGRFLIAFRNSDTDQWATGSYATEIRVALNPKRNLKLSAYVISEETTPITITIDEDTCLAYVTGDSGTVILSYTSSWSGTLSDYGITVTGTPVNGDKIVITYNKNADGSVVDGDTVRTITKSKSTITIMDVLKGV